MTRLLSVPLLAVAVALGLAVPAHAEPATATLAVSPNPTSAYYAGTETFVGCGYDPADWVDVYVTPPGAAFGSVVGAGPVDTAGCIDVVTAGWVAGAGLYPAAAAHQVQTGQTVKVRELAGETVTVV